MCLVSILLTVIAISWLQIKKITTFFSLKRLFIPESESQVELIEGEDEADAGRKLALRLRELNLI